jgi:phosphate transport system substrate-binding protein
VSLTWILLKQQGNGAKLDSIKKAFGFTLSDQAQAMAPELGFITLPTEVLVKARKALAGIR